MSTKAIVAVQGKDGKIRAKYSHYGLYDDYHGEIACSNYAKYCESVNRGDSSSPFDGFYDDWQHCKQLGWDYDTYKNDLDRIKPAQFDSLDELEKYARENWASFIYLKHEDESLDIYEWYGKQRGFISWFDDIDAKEPIDMSTFDDLSLEDIKDAIFDAIDFTGFGFGYPWRQFNCGIDSDEIESIGNVDDAKQIAYRFNKMLPDIKARLKEEILNG